MTDLHIAPDVSHRSGIESPSAHAEANADRIARARRHAANCVLLAVVTSPETAAELIDRAIEHHVFADTINGT